MNAPSVNVCSWMCAALVLMGSTVSTYAESVPVRGTTDPRIRTAAYADDEVYQLKGFVGYGIELVFERGEHFAGQAGGDLDAILFGAHENHVILKPRAANVGTNFVVYTNRRAYRFDYTVEDRKPNPRKDDVIYAVRFTYPPSPTTDAGPTAAERIDAELAGASEARPHNIDYWFC